MKVLLIRAFADSDKGGIEQSYSQLSDALKSKGYEVTEHHLVDYHGRLFNIIKILIRICLKLTNRQSPTNLAILGDIVMSRLTRQKQILSYDYVFHYSFPSEFMFRSCSGIHIGWVHTDLFLRKVPSFVDTWLSRRIRYVAVSEHVNKDLVQRGINSYFVPHHYTENFVEKKREVMYDFIFVGRFSEVKQPLKFVELLNQVKKNYNWRGTAVMVGDGPLYNEIERLLQKYDLEKNVRLTGWIPNVTSIYELSGMLIQTSKYEGRSLVLDEGYINNCRLLILNYPSARENCKAYEKSAYQIVEYSQMSKSMGEYLELNRDYKHAPDIKRVKDLNRLFWEKINILLV